MILSSGVLPYQQSYELGKELKWGATHRQIGCIYSEQKQDTQQSDALV